MSATTADVDFEMPPRWRFRFTTKTLLVLASLIAIWLTIRTLRTRQADRVISRVSATYQLLAQSFDQPPTGMTIAVQQPAGFRSPLPGRESVLRAGRLVSERMSIVQLTPSPGKALMPSAEIDPILRNHFLSALAQYGFRQQVKPNKPVIDPSVSKNIESSVVTWYDPRSPEFEVTMQVLQDKTQPLVTVLIQAKGDQPIPGGRLGSWFGQTATFVVALMILTVVLRSMLSWGWR
jgi:hypothetical protein